MIRIWVPFPHMYICVHVHVYVVVCAQVMTGKGLKLPPVGPEISPAHLLVNKKCRYIALISVYTFSTVVLLLLLCQR